MLSQDIMHSKKHLSGFYVLPNLSLLHFTLNSVKLNKLNHIDKLIAIVISSSFRIVQFRLIEYCERLTQLRYGLDDGQWN